MCHAIFVRYYIFFPLSVLYTVAFALLEIVVEVRFACEFGVQFLGVVDAANVFGSDRPIFEQFASRPLKDLSISIPVFRIIDALSDVLDDAFLCEPGPTYVDYALLVVAVRKKVCRNELGSGVNVVTLVGRSCNSNAVCKVLTPLCSFIVLTLSISRFPSAVSNTLSIPLLRANASILPLSSASPTSFDPRQKCNFCALISEYMLFMQPKTVTMTYIRAALT